MDDNADERAEVVAIADGSLLILFAADALIEVIRLRVSCMENNAVASCPALILNIRDVVLRL